MQSSLELAPEPMLFESTIARCLFFDDGNHQVIALRSGKMSGLILNCDPNNMSTTVLCLDLSGPQTIMDIKFSVDNKLMAIQLCKKSIEIYRFDPERPELNTLLVEKKFCDQIDFVWVNTVELLVVTKKRADLYRLKTEPYQLESQCNIAHDILWYSWCKIGHMALVASQRGKVLTPYVIKHSDSWEKLAPIMLVQSKMNAIQKADVTLTQVYGTKTILILKRMMDEVSEIEFHQLINEGAGFVRTHVLDLGVVGSDVKIQIVDNLIVTHDTELHVTMMFDIKMQSEKRNEVMYHSPITTQKALLQSENRSDQKFDYSNAQFFAPNLVVVPQMGRLWRIQLNLTKLYQTIFKSEPVRLFDILLHRKNSKSYILSLLQHITAKFDIHFYEPMKIIFDRLNQIYKLELQINNHLQGLACDQVFVKTSTIAKNYINQNDMLKNIFEKISDPKQTEFVLLIYLDSLMTHRICANPKLSRCVVETMVVRRNMHALEVMLCQKTIKDSTDLADYLLTIESEEDPRFFQLALDMLSRLQEYQKMFRVLSERGKVMDAIAMAVKLNREDLLNQNECLEAAKRCPLVQHAVEMFFLKENRFVTKL